MAKNKWTCIAEKKFNNTIVITDPHYLNINGGEEEVKEIIGRRGLASTTFYGDWGCTVYTCGKRVGYISKKFSRKIGEFCADSGLVCVVSLGDAEKHFPDSLRWLSEHKWCGTIIEGFNGTVRFMTRNYDIHLDSGKTIVDTELRVHGDGTVYGNKFSFESIQTSL